MTKKGILITGMTGQLGRALRERLRNFDAPVYCLIHKPKERYPFDFGGLQVFEADITKRESVFKHAEDLRGRVDVIFHMASLPHGYPKKELYKNIFEGTVNLYEFAGEIGCPRFLYFSSILAAGWAPKSKAFIDENHIPQKSKFCYFGKMKLAAETKLLELSAGNATKTIILRLGNVYGPPKLSFVKFVTELLRKRRKIFYQRAKESAMWAPVFTQDVLDCMMMLSRKDLFNNQVYLLTGNGAKTLGEITNIIAPLAGIDIGEMDDLNPIQRCHLAASQAIDSLRGLTGRPSFPNFAYSNEKLRKDFGFSPKTELKDGILLTFKWGLREGLL